MKKILTLTLCTLFIMESQYFLLAMEGEPVHEPSNAPKVDPKAQAEAQAKHQQAITEHEATMKTQQAILESSKSTPQQKADAQTTMRNSQLTVMDSHSNVMQANSGGGFDLNTQNSSGIIAKRPVENLNVKTMTHEMTSNDGNTHVTTKLDAKTGNTLSSRTETYDSKTDSTKITTVDNVTGKTTITTTDAEGNERTITKDTPTENLGTRTKEQVQADKQQAKVVEATLTPVEVTKISRSAENQFKNGDRKGAAENTLATTDPNNTLPKDVRDNLTAELEKGPKNGQSWSDWFASIYQQIVDAINNAMKSVQPASSTTVAQTPTTGRPASPTSVTQAPTVDLFAPKTTGDAMATLNSASQDLNAFKADYTSGNTATQKKGYTRRADKQSTGPSSLANAGFYQ